MTLTLGMSPSYPEHHVFPELLLRMGTICLSFRVMIEIHTMRAIYREHPNRSWSITYHDVVFQMVLQSWPAALAVPLEVCPHKDSQPPTLPLGVLICTVPLLTVEQPLTIKSDILKIKNALN